jgi:CheY-like chemotaxis protein
MSLQLLIVDDNAHFLEAARDLLEQEGMAVVALASTSAEAVERVAEFRPDVALVDIDLGEESGFDLATQLTQPLIGPAPRVVLISAYAEQDLHDLIEDSPAVGFLSKADLSAQAILQLLAIPDRGRPDASS